MEWNRQDNLHSFVYNLHSEPEWYSYKEEFLLQALFYMIMGFMYLPVAMPH